MPRMRCRPLLAACAAAVLAYHSYTAALLRRGGSCTASPARTCPGGLVGFVAGSIFPESRISGRSELVRMQALKRLSWLGSTLGNTSQQLLACSDDAIAVCMCLCALQYMHEGVKGGAVHDRSCELKWPGLQLRKKEKIMKNVANAKKNPRSLSKRLVAKQMRKVDISVVNVKRCRRARAGIWSNS